nr:hypothetical protein [Epilithonimonas hungarica]
MIAIVDGGSTKCDWVILENDGTEVLKTETVGFNPNIIKPELITIEIEKKSGTYQVQRLSGKHLFLWLRLRYSGK